MIYVPRVQVDAALSKDGSSYSVTAPDGSTVTTVDRGLFDTLFTPQATDMPVRPDPLPVQVETREQPATGPSDVSAEANTTPTPLESAP